MQTLKLVAVALLLATGCSKSDKADKKAEPAAKSGDLAWQPDGMDKLSAACKKALACCEAAVVAKTPAATAADYNGACSGPAMGTWKDSDCAADATARASAFGGKPVPDVCK